MFQPSDMKALLWCIDNRTTPDSYLYLTPPSAADGKAPGNPYVDVQKVLAIARASALPEAQKKFDAANIGHAAAVAAK